MRPTHRTVRSLLLASLALPLSSLSGTLALAGAPRAPAGDPADVGDAKLSVIGDGKGHFLVVDAELSGDRVFYGDGKALWQLRIGSGGGQKNDQGGWERRSMSFWDPRWTRGVEASIDLGEGGKWSVTCGSRTTAMTALSEADGSKLLGSGKLFKGRWKHRAYALARDEKGTYYYVDRAREPEGNKSFRLFSGPKGNMKPLKMTNVVSDSEGDIFSTRSGELRLVLNKNEYVWLQGKAKQKLLPVPSRTTTS